MHASIGVGGRTFEYDLSDIVEGSTAPETAAYLKSIVCDVLRRQAVLMVHCGLVGLTYPHEVTVLGMDNEPLNGAAVADFESFRAISEVLLDMVTLVEEAWLNKVDMHACLDAAIAGLKLPPRPRCHDAAREIPSPAELDKKPYVLLNSKPCQRYHANFGCLHSIVVAATRYEIVERSKLQGGLAAGVATHVAEFNGSLALGKARMDVGTGGPPSLHTLRPAARHHCTRV
ncbi:hypothetical protein M885DRAFT_300532 [Pelagophyceae sp. CCMP2097]|nr:hypothetical protein M885DRAFT_300532 [Pelagophyceae sp. CCMP2097]